MAAFGPCEPISSLKAVAHSGAELEVRIQSPPAESQQTFGFPRMPRAAESVSVFIPCGPAKKGDNQIDRSRVLEVRIHSPPADSLGLAQTRPLQVEKAAVPRGCVPLRSAETRCTGRNCANRRCYLCRGVFQYRSAADVIGQPRPQVSSPGSISQAKPSRARCSCQASGRREWASSLSAVRWGG
jgi:hypothetical protein